MTAESSAQLDLLPTGQPLPSATTEAACWSLGVLLGLLSLSAATLAWRRVVGALTSPLSPSMLLTVGLMVAVTVSCARLLQRRVFARGSNGRCETQSRQIRWLVALLPLVSAVAIGISLSLSGTAPTALSTFWALIAVEECWAWRAVIMRLIQRRRDRAQEESGGANTAAATVVRTVQCALNAGIPPSTMLQHITRSRAADGSEELAGWVRVPFAAGQRTGNAHLAFCPPFSTTPELLVEQVDGPRCRIKTVQLLPYGARLEVKCAAVAVAENPSGVLLRFAARTRGGTRDPG
jgi:hypothetical protein